MSMIFKVLWGVRAVLYNLFFIINIRFPSYIGKPTYIEGKNIKIGKRCRIFPGLRAETHNGGAITIDSNVAIAQNLHITSGDDLFIGEGTCIAANVCITNIIHNYYDLSDSILNSGVMTKETKIGKHCFIGYGSVIQPGAILADNVIVGALSVVTGHIPSGSIVVGSPAKIIKRYNESTSSWEKVSREGFF